MWPLYTHTRRITFPTYYAHNLLIGTLRMEVGDVGHIVCTKTNLRAVVEFQQKSLFGPSDRLNSLTATIKKTAPSEETLYTITGHWDKVMHITSKKGEKEVFLDVRTEAVR